MKHFNHTQIHRGVCVTKTCERFIKDQTNDTADPRQTLEACLNHSIWESYKIQARLNGIRYCKRASDTIDIDTYDVIVAVVYVILIALNVIGSCYDNVFCKKRKKSGKIWLKLLNFRIFLYRTWYTLNDKNYHSCQKFIKSITLFIYL